MKIVLGAILWSVGLGIAIDLVTANVAVDYFAKYHPHVVDSTSPWILALVWGVIASWWAGSIGGAILALINWRLRPPLPANLVLRWVRNSCAIIWCVMMAIVAGVYMLAGLIPIEQRRATYEYDRRLMAVAIAHMGEYFFAFVAVIVIALMMRKYAKSHAS